jgi:hypothetical protein
MGFSSSVNHMRSNNRVRKRGEAITPGTREHGRSQESRRQQRTSRWHLGCLVIAVLLVFELGCKLQSGAGGGHVALAKAQEPSSLFEPSITNNASNCKNPDLS